MAWGKENKILSVVLFPLKTSCIVNSMEKQKTFFSASSCKYRSRGMYIPFFSLAANTSDRKKDRVIALFFKQQKTHLIEQNKKEH
jgi:hypothetical protein